MKPNIGDTVEMTGDVKPEFVGKRGVVIGYTLETVCLVKIPGYEYTVHFSVENLTVMDAEVKVREWACVGHEPTAWAYGFVSNGVLFEAIAAVERRPSGRWHWELRNWFIQGEEPSMETAIEACMRNMETK